jgi:hypothetical protein
MDLNNEDDHDHKDAVKRGLEIRNSPPLAAVINADYGAPDLTHGPEGLFMVRGVRLDGAARCDDDYNAALRPWLGLGEGLDVTTERIPAEINQLETDGSEIPAWMHTGIGGGPWLIQDGEIVQGAVSCIGEKELTQLDPVTNCTGNYKAQKQPPLLERYAGGSCRASFHTAAGISRDQRWLFLLITTSLRDPGTIARFMRDELGVWQGMKFDGGGSTQLLYNPQDPVTIDPKETPNEKPRKLTNFLGIYAESGNGILLPLMAEPTEPVFYQVLKPGETAKIQLEVKNTGDFAWNPEDDVELREEPWFFLSPAIEALPLKETVKPEETSTWDWEINTDGLLINRFQMYQKGEPFGSKFAVVVVVLPGEWMERQEEFEQKIQEIIDDWKKQGEEELDQLLQHISTWVQRELGKWFQRLIDRTFQAIADQIASVCQSVSLILGTLVIIILRRRFYY